MPRKGINDTMPRRDMEYWARLRVDAPSSWAAGMAIVSVLAAVLALLGLVISGGQAEARANPLYWLILLPVAWWGGGLSGFGARQVRLMTPAIILAPLLAAMCLAIAARRGEVLVPWSIATLIAFAGATASRFFYGKSLLKREGPDRYS